MTSITIAKALTLQQEFEALIRARVTQLWQTRMLRYSKLTVADEIENALNYLHGEKGMSGLTLNVHPFIHAYLTKGFLSIQRKWYWRWKKWVKVQPEGALQFLAYTVQDGSGNVVPL